MSTSTHDPGDSPEPRKGRSNAILTYETVEQINLGIQEALLRLGHLNDKIASQMSVIAEHEVRIRALELTLAGSTASTGTAKFLYQAVWPLAACVISILGFLKP